MSNEYMGQVEQRPETTAGVVAPPQCGYFPPEAECIPANCWAYFSAFKLWQEELFGYLSKYSRNDGQ